MKRKKAQLWYYFAGRAVLIDEKEINDSGINAYSYPFRSNYYTKIVTQDR
jgi:hypothetical protein